MSEGREGYRDVPRGGARVRADVVDVYVFRRRGSSEQEADSRSGEGIEFLQVLRSSEPLSGTWHPVMGHVEAGETCAACALRELDEELALRAGDGALVGVWALEQVHPFYIAAIDSIVLSPRFAAEVRREWTPPVRDEHSDVRWVRAEEAGARFMWPGQVAAVEEITRFLLPEGSLSRDRLRIQ